MDRPSPKPLRRVGGEIRPPKTVRSVPAAVVQTMPSTIAKKPFAQYYPSHNVRMAQPAAKKPAPSPTPPDPPLRKQFEPPEVPTKRRGFIHKMQIPIIIGVGIVLGILVQSPALGQIAAIAYGVAALLFRIDSRTTFTLALMAIVSTIFMVIIHMGSQLAHAFANYAFLLLLVGIVSAIIEAREEQRLRRKRRGAARRLR